MSNALALHGDASRQGISDCLALPEPIDAGGADVYDCIHEHDCT